MFAKYLLKYCHYHCNTTGAKRGVRTVQGARHFRDKPTMLQEYLSSKGEQASTHVITSVYQIRCYYLTEPLNRIVKIAMR